MNKIKRMTIEDNEEFLRQVSRPVDFPDDELEEDIKRLEEFFRESESTIALAAIQIGIPKKLIYLKTTDLDLINRINHDQETEEDKNHNEHRVLINPVVLSREGLTDYWEACASCLNNIGHVRRPYRIEVEYQDTSGEIKREEFEGFESTVLSHELDHLDGILHMDIADEVLVMTKEERKLFRHSHGYNIISKKGDYEKLLRDTKPLAKTKSSLKNN